MVTTNIYVRNVNSQPFKSLKVYAKENNLFLYEAVNLAFSRLVKGEQSEKNQIKNSKKNSKKKRSKKA